MTKPLHTIVETPPYLAAAKKAGMAEEDRTLAVDLIAADPEGGEMIVGTNGVRKVRVAKPGTGKSGGWRVLTAFVSKLSPVYLLTAYGKNQKASISKAERNEMAKLMEELKAEVRSKN